MKHLKSFKIFEAGFLGKNNVIVPFKSISDGEISREMVDTCEDIIRDFNEDNDTSVNINMQYVDTDARLPEKVRETLLKEEAKNIIFIRAERPRPLRTNWSRVRQDAEIVEMDKLLKESCMKHIISYFESLGYKFMKYQTSYAFFFYFSDKPIKVNPLKRFGKYVKNKLFNEKIVDYDSENIKLFYNELNQILTKKRSIPFNIVAEVGKKNDVEVVDYDTFRSELPNEQAKKDAPPRYVTFALVNPSTKKARIVMAQAKMDKELLDHCYHMLKHENIHIGQFSRRSDEYSEFLGNVMNKKQYYSNKDEIMAFSQSISDKLMDYKPSSIEDALSK